VKDILAWNHLANPQQGLKSGRTLFIYLPDSSVQTSQAADSTRSTKDDAKYSGKRVVKPGETIYGISIELGVPISDFAKINNLNAKCSMISPGYVLRYAPKPAPASKAKVVKR